MQAYVGLRNGGASLYKPRRADIYTGVGSRGGVRDITLMYTGQPRSSVDCVGITLTPQEARQLGIDLLALFSTKSN